MTPPPWQIGQCEVRRGRRPWTDPGECDGLLVTYLGNRQGTYLQMNPGQLLPRSRKLPETAAPIDKLRRTRGWQIRVPDAYSRCRHHLVPCLCEEPPGATCL